MQMYGNVPPPVMFITQLYRTIAIHYMSFVTSCRLTCRFNAHNHLTANAHEK